MKKFNQLKYWKNNQLLDYSLNEDGCVEKIEFVNNVTIWVKGMDTDFALDLDAEPDYLLGHLAFMEIDNQYHVEFGGLNG